MKVSIRTKLIVAILLPLLAVYCGVLAGNYYSARREVVAQAERYLLELANNDAANIDEQFRIAEQAASSIASLAAEQSRDVFERRSELILRGALLSRADLQAVTVYLEPPADDGGQSGPPFGRFVARQVQHLRQARPGGSGVRVPRPRPGPPGAGATGSGAPATAPASPAAPDLSDPTEEAGESQTGSAAEVYVQAVRRGDVSATIPDFDRQQWYLGAKGRGRAVWTEPLVDDKIAVVPVCRRVAPIVREGQFVGVVAADLSIRSLRRALGATKLEGGYCLLVSRDGLIVGHPAKDIAMHETLAHLARREKTPELEAIADAMAGGYSRRVDIQDSYTGLPSWMVFAPVRSSGWSFAIVIPRRKVLAPVQDWLRRDLAVMVGGLGLIVFVVTMVSVRITRPIGRLVAAVRVLGGGDLHSRVGGTHRRDEFGELSRAFNGMVRAIAHHIDARMREAAARKAVESELQVAREIQASLLPTGLPDRPELELHATVVPAREVAGDFFDYFYVSENVLAIVIADVSGKGVPASIFMAVSRTVIRDHALAGLAPAEVLNRANRLLAQGNERMMFVTIFFAHYEISTGRLIYANAGHNPPCLTNGAGGVRSLGSPTGPILGVFENEHYSQKQAQLQPGESVVLYTDGVTEAMDAQGRPFRLEHLARILADNPKASPEEICGLVVQSVEDHRAHGQQDDVTMLVLRRKL
jgi:sigma-B regulation protein RsbU (phosphoserine phosphatase)